MIVYISMDKIQKNKKNNNNNRLKAYTKNCWDKSEKFYIAKLIAQFLSLTTNVEIQKKKVSAL